MYVRACSVSSIFIVIIISSRIFVNTGIISIINNINIFTSFSFLITVTLADYFYSE